MRFDPKMAPVKCVIFPLLKNKPELVNKAREVKELLLPFMNVFYDEAGAVGRRYRRQDEIGTPFGVTVDHETMTDQTVTLRDRDAMTQIRISVARLVDEIRRRIDPQTRGC